MPSKTPWSLRILIEVAEPLARLIDAVAPFFDQVDQCWRRNLERAEFPETEYPALEKLTLRVHARALADREVDRFKDALERTGRTLAAQGVPEERAVTSFVVYVECCVPYLPEVPHAVRTLMHLIQAGQVFIFSGYAARRAETWRGIDDKERHRLSRDLHDEVGHNLIVLKLYLEMMQIDLREGQYERMREKLEESLALTSHSVESIRRLILDLGPAILDEIGFKPALKLYTRQFSARTGIDVHLVVGDLPANLPPTYEATVYRTIQGALSNVLEHSQATTVTVTLGSIRNRVLILTIEDNGVGFDTRTRPLGFGLKAISERIELLGGRFHLTSRPIHWFSDDHGTRIEIDLPLEGV